ncbi:MAG TPA: hypothetical protein DCO77_13545 [Nitrospiraceae bacterium]|nr:hypothetical protein [Nitrospiraceae bacterium]
MMIQASGKQTAFLGIIFIASLASITYEITLLRIFSLSLWYHFAFMVISIAMLGLGASGTLLALYPRLKQSRAIPLLSLLLGISICLSYFLANSIPFDPARLPWDRIQLLYISLYYSVLLAPFFCFGLIVSIAFSTMTAPTGYIYAADLAGGGAGAILTFLFLSLGSPEQTVLIISIFPLLATMTHPGRTIKILATVCVLIVLSLLYRGPQFLAPRVSPYKPLQVALQFPGAEHISTLYSPYSRVDLFKSPAARFAPGLSFKYLEDLPDQTGITIDGGAIHAITDERNQAKLDFINYLPSGIPYILSRKEDVLILEPKAGLGVLMAKHYGSKNIYAVDSNPLVIEAVRRQGKQIASNIYDNNTWTGMGRSWLASSTKRFDIIDLSIMGAMPSSSFGFSEDYRYTVEAFDVYIESLKPEGFLSLTLFIIPPSRTELRLLNTIMAAAEQLGIQDAAQHIAAIRSWGSLTLLFKKSPLTSDDVKRIKRFSRTMRFDLVTYPGIQESESNVYIKTPDNAYYHSFQQISRPQTRVQFENAYPFDIRPVHDENPFFHYYLKFKHIGSIYQLMGKKWQFFIEEGYLLPIQFLQASLLSIVLIVLPLLRLRTARARPGSPNLMLLLPYFACLGLGFLFIEVSFIQKMILVLETPAHAASTVIASLLISSGIGSALSQRRGRLSRPAVLLVLAGIALVYSFMLPWTMSSIAHFSTTIKIALVFLLLMPAGALMGIPFPLGLTFIGRTRPELIPWAWAINGCFSVLAPILAVMLALSTGFNMVILAGASMYCLAFALLARAQKAAG